MIDKIKKVTAAKRKFIISPKDYCITRVGQKIEGINWVNIFIVLDGLGISFFLDMHPMSKSRLKYREKQLPEVDGSNINYISDLLCSPPELELVPNGIPWRYIDRQKQFENLSVTSKQVIFWCNEYTITINNSYQFFPDFIEMIKS